MKVELEAHFDDVTYTIYTELHDYGSILYHAETKYEPADIEIVCSPVFGTVVVMDEDGNTWEPSRKQRETINELLEDWWYTEATENRL